MSNGFGIGSEGKGVSLMKNQASGWTVSSLSMRILAGFGLFAMCGFMAQAQEKRTVFTESDFHWQAKLAPGQTLEIIGRNGEIEANGGADDSAQVNATRRGHGDSEKEAFIEVVEYSDGVTICAVYAREARPGRCHRGGVDSESGSFWHNSRAKITFSAQVPRGVVLKAETTNGDIHARDLNSVVEADTTNGSVDVSTSEWASGRTTNGHVDVTIGKAGWNGELELATTNGGITVSLPASAEFKVRASTTTETSARIFPLRCRGHSGRRMFPARWAPAAAN